MSASPVLSVLDTHPVFEGVPAQTSIRNGLELALAAERLGYHRYWVAEHHNTPGLASSAPTVLIGRVAAATERIRVGSGGVMLPNHPPLVVAEQFATLEVFHPGRIDLGVGRAPGTDPLTAGALRRSSDPLSAQDFPEQVKELEYYLDGGKTPRGPGLEIRAVPEIPARPPVWMLGSSPSSGLLAAGRGMPYAYANHLRPDAAAAATRAYRENFQPSEAFPEPYVIVTAFLIAADTDEEAAYQSGSLAHALVSGRSNPFSLFPQPEDAARRPLSAAELQLVQASFAGQLIGSADTVKAQLADLVDRTGADEVMAVAPIADHAARVHAYEILAR
ncbi:LLM class flavin-dependent oxidoreductase [Amycolatopsis sp. NBC_00345]|uniref:LLM class flavin-dependent oxidoreductase n=1 Tax=Amycolatopsis sp. NBC_00345 TaxID=2975955 RepID=UPI002E26C6DD